MRQWVDSKPGREGYAPRSKQTPYETGIRQPIFFNWPAKLKPADRDELVSVPSFPTIVRATELACRRGCRGWTSGRICRTARRSNARRLRRRLRPRHRDLYNLRKPCSIGGRRGAMKLLRLRWRGGSLQDHSSARRETSAAIRPSQGSARNEKRSRE